MIYLFHVSRRIECRDNALRIDDGNSPETMAHHLTAEFNVYIRSTRQSNGVPLRLADCPCSLPERVLVAHCMPADMTEVHHCKLSTVIVHR